MRAIALAVLLCLSSTASAVISNGANAIDALGQFTDQTGATVTYTKSCMNNGASPIGFYNPEGVALDATNHRLFVSNGANNRVLVYNLNSDNTLPAAAAPANVLGQTNFSGCSAAVTQSRMSLPTGLAFDSVNNRLFVADRSNHRVLVYNTTTITDGMNAANVLGQTLFTTAAAPNPPNQASMDLPFDVSFDAVNNRLFVADASNQRVLVYDTTTITNGMNATYLFGEGGSFTTWNIAMGPAWLSSPEGVAVDTANNLLFVSDSGHNRVVVFDIATITNGEASIAALGQPNNSSGMAAATTQAGMSQPLGLTFDATNHRLFVMDYSNNRVLVFNTTTITTGMNAANVLGQANFTTATAATTQAGMNFPYYAAFDATNNRLLVGDKQNQRVLVFNTTTITDGMNASNLLGQYDSATSSATVVYTKALANNGPFAIGLNAVADVELDAVNHRLFVADTSNNRVLVYNLNPDNSFPDRIADNVLGQPDFMSLAAATTQAGMKIPSQLTVDVVNNRLFVADTSNNRVLVFNTATITNGMNAANVLGQANFTTNTAATTQAGMFSPEDLAFDAANNRLFMADYNNNRVLVFNTATISNGMNAANVLGQADFITATFATTQAIGKRTTGIAFDARNNRLFVSNPASNRVLVFNTATITNGMNAVNVLGQPNFITETVGLTQAGMGNPNSVNFDAENNRLFVADASNNRVLVYDTTAITDGMNAANVFGPTNFTTNAAGTTQAVMSGPVGVYFDPGSGLLFVPDQFNNRVMIFDAAALSSNFLLITPP
jgi:DNA-binding beta-propeller fold protein YncE